MADNNKIVTLGNIAILKDYINRNIEKASKMLNEEYDTQFNVLQQSITALENLGTLDELTKLQLELDALKANFEDKKEALEILKTDFENLSNGITDGTVFSAGQLNEIISTALIDETVITDEMVSTPNVFTQKIVALIGNFGKINAGQVEAGTLKGSNVESTNKIDYTDDPVWRLNNNGSGWLANKNISWDENGNVNFGSNVKLSWNNISDTDNIATTDSINAAIGDINEVIADEYNKVINEAIYDAKTELNNNISESNEKAEEAIAKAAEIQAELNTIETKITEVEENTTESITPLVTKLAEWQSDNNLSPFELSEIEKDKNNIVEQYTKLKEDIDNLNTNLTEWSNGVEDGSIPSEMDSTSIINLKIDYTVLTKCKDDVVEVYNYYNSNINNDTGCAQLNTEYSLSVIPAYYAVQNEYIRKYQEVATEYITNNRFGSKTTWISDKGIYSGTISGDNIIGEKISGLTIQSGSSGELAGGGEGPYWKLNKDGSGYLAKKNINWSGDGKVTFGSNVELKWGDISGKPDMGDYATKEDLDSIETGLNEDDVSGIISTTITKDYIESLEVRAKDIIGDTISGKTIQSSTNATLNGGGEGPCWKINNDGSGYLANKNINWSGDGKVTFGSNVELKWGNITGTETITNDISAANATASAASAKADTANATASAASTKADTASSALEALNTRVDSLNNYSEDDIKAYATDITSKMITTPEIYALTITADKVKASALEAESATIGKIASDNIVVKKLNTVPDKGTDKIEISDNHLYCVDDTGNRNLIVSSYSICPEVTGALTDNLGFSAHLLNKPNFFKNAAFSNPEENEKPLTAAAGPYLIVGDGEGDYIDDRYVHMLKGDEFEFSLNGNNKHSVGVLFSGAKLQITPALYPYSATVPEGFTGINMLTLDQSKCYKSDNWIITSDCVIKLYIKNSSGDFEEIDEQIVTPGSNVTMDNYKNSNNSYGLEYLGKQLSRIDISNYNWSGADFGTETSPYQKCAKNIIFDIDRTGTYYIGLKFVKHSIGKSYGNDIYVPYLFVSEPNYTSTGDITDFVPQSIAAVLSLNIENNNPKTYTEIGKDGIIVFNGETLLTCNAKEVEMRANKQKATNLQVIPNFYGFKVTKDGIYYCNGNASYKKWEPSI